MLILSSFLDCCLAMKVSDLWKSTLERDEKEHNMSEFYDKMANAYNDLAQCQSNNQKDLIVTDLQYFIVLKF